MYSVLRNSVVGIEIEAPSYFLFAFILFFFFFFFFIFFFFFFFFFFNRLFPGPIVGPL